MNTLAVPARYCRDSRGASPRRLTPGARGGVLFAVVLSLTITACAGGQDKKLILSANDLQDAAARVYQAASAEESRAGNACAAAAAKVGVVLPAPSPATIDASRKTCSDLGTPIPYDPFKLEALAGPINAAYEAIRAADAVRRGTAKGDISTSIAAMLEAVTRLWTAAGDVGMKLPPNTLGGGK